jgi:ubiquinone/menaquinone biosynthesis C-methylase UbiE
VALDIGCGSGIQTLALAQRGWEVTGVDVVERALTQARERLAAAHASARIVRADATELPAEVVGNAFDFVFDLGCFHGLKPDEQDAMARAVTARTKPSATMLMLAFGKPVGPPFMPSGATRQRIESAFTDWTVVEVVKVPTDIPGMPRIARRAEPTFYRLRRRSSDGSGAGGQ